MSQENNMLTKQSCSLNYADTSKKLVCVQQLQSLYIILHETHSYNCPHKSEYYENSGLRFLLVPWHLQINGIVNVKESFARLTMHATEQKYFYKRTQKILKIDFRFQRNITKFVALISYKKNSRAIDDGVLCKDLLVRISDLYPYQVNWHILHWLLKIIRWMKENSF